MGGPVDRVKIQGICSTPFSAGAAGAAGSIGAQFLIYWRTFLPPPAKPAEDSKSSGGKRINYKKKSPAALLIQYNYIKCIIEIIKIKF